MKRRIDHQEQQKAQHVALWHLCDAADKATKHAEEFAEKHQSKAKRPSPEKWCLDHCRALLLENLEEIRYAINGLYFLNESGELNSEDWQLVCKLFNDLAAATPQMNFPMKRYCPPEAAANVA